MNNLAINKDAKAGDVIQFCKGPYIKILKRVNDNTFSIQMFYTDTNKKFTDPFIMKNNIPEGAVTFWYENSKKQQAMTYKDGKHQGAYTSWYKNGQKHVETYQKMAFMRVLIVHGMKMVRKNSKHNIRMAKKWT